MELRRALERVHHSDAALVDDLIEELLRAGDRAGAIEAYRQFAHVHPNAAQTHARLRRTYERALWSVPRELPTNVPVARSALVGRDGEIAEIAESLALHGSLTLLGPAGIGKTRLALEVGRRVLADFPDGVWWCDLTSAVAPEQLYAVLADALKLESGPADVEAVCAGMRGRSALIILDRCEPLTVAVEQLIVRLRSECAGTCVLMTSQLPVENAHTIRLQNLSLPPDGKVQRADAVASEAVRLFVERAVEADHSFALTDANASKVADICRRVEGSPFALEIAAAYLAHVPLEQLASRIADRTLREVSNAAYVSVDWAYHLLAPPDAALLRHVSIFPKYWTIDGADALFGSQAAPGVERLVAVSLVVAERLESGLTRYSLLDATRHYAYERLVTCGEFADVRVRFIDRMIAAMSDLQSVNQRTSHAAADAIQFAVDLSHALQFGIDDEGCVERALQLCGLLSGQARRLAVLSSAFGLVKDLLGCAKEAGLTQTAHYAQALSTYAWLANYSGDHALANDLYAQAIASARACDDGPRLARVLSAAIPPLLNSGRYTDAKAFAEEALESGRVADDVAACAEALRGLSAIEYFNGRYEQAIAYYERFMQLPQDRVPPARIALMLNGLSAIMARKGDYARAQAAAERAARIAYENGDYGGAAHAEKNLGFFLLAEGHLLEGHEALRRAVSLAQMSANRLTQLDALEELAAASIRKDQFESIAYVLGHVDAERERVRFRADGKQAERAQRIRAVVQRLYGIQSYKLASARGELARPSEVFAAVSRLRPGDGTLERLDRFGELSVREREVAELALQGLTNRAIAQALSVSVRTVDAHMAMIFRKLGIERRDQI